MAEEGMREAFVVTAVRSMLRKSEMRTAHRQLNGSLAALCSIVAVNRGLLSALIVLRETKQVVTHFNSLTLGQSSWRDAA